MLTGSTVFINRVNHFTIQMFQVALFTKILKRQRKIFTFIIKGIIHIEHHCFLTLDNTHHSPSAWLVLYNRNYYTSTYPSRSSIDESHSEQKYLKLSMTKLI